MTDTLVRLFWVCLGGAAGSGARYLVGLLALRVAGPGFPYGTLAVNVLGSFLLGGLMHVGTTTAALPRNALLAVTTGVMGGFTTYSSFNYETLRYFQAGHAATGALYLALTVLACLAAGAAGTACARWLVG